MAYVYRHIRHDKNEPFYIGIGKDNDGSYKRAYTNGNRGRNRYWNNIVSITTYDVEIIFDDLSWSEACKKEIEFIELYKRRKDGGCLANLTLGGEGQLGMYGELNGMYGRITSEETKEKQRIRKIGKPPPNKGVKMSKEQREKLSIVHKGQTAWNKGIPFSQESRKKMSDARKGKPSNCIGIKWSKEACERASIQRKGRIPWNKGKGKPKIKKGRSLQVHAKKVIQFSITGEFIAEHISVGHAARATGAHRPNIVHCCSGRIKKTGGFKWGYKK